MLFVACLLFSPLLTYVPYAEGQCEHEWNGRCLSLLESSFTSWWQARQACVGGGMEVASIRDSQEQLFLFQLVLNQTSDQSRPKHVYIGLTDAKTKGTFEWVDNTPVSYRNYTEPVASFYDDDRSCFVMHSSSAQWLPNFDDKEWLPVSCCFFTDVRHVLCAKPSTSQAQTSGTVVKDFCVGNCPSDSHAYKGSCYWMHVAPSDQKDVTQENINCQQHKAELLRYSGVDEAFLTFGLSALAFKESKSILDFWLSHVNNVCHVSTWSSRGLSSKEVDCCKERALQATVCKKPSSSDVTFDVKTDSVAQTCYANVDECASQPCMNGGVCEDLLLDYRCNCSIGFIGDNCQTQNRACESTPCLNNGTCTPNNSSYTCLCTPEYNGTNCQFLWNHCLSDPCLNGGTCTNTYTSTHSFVCTCDPLYTGRTCDTVNDPVDECASNPCQDGVCVNLLGSYQCECSLGKTGVNCENDVVCPVLSVANANETLAFGRGFGERRAYQCLPGHLFSDLTSSKEVSCQQNSTWNDSAVMAGCKESCPFLPVVNNSNLDKRITVVNTTITFTCITGHVINGNITEVSFRCREDRTWEPSSTLLSCLPRVCPVLPTHSHQNMDKRDHVYDTTVTFWCDQGYHLFDASTIRTIKCLADGQWSAALPSCQPKRCPDLQLKSRQMRNTSANTYETYAKYVCDTGYRMLDGSSYKVIFCNAEQEWTDNITDCAPNRCFPLPYVANATPSTTNADYWTKSVLTCIPGHKFKRHNGEFSYDTMICQQNGWWNPIFTSCEPIYCPPISIVGKNLTRDTEQRLYGTKVKYSCLKGFYLDRVLMQNSFENQCLETQEWSKPFIRGCHPITCPAPPPAPSNGVRSTLTSSQQFYSQVVSYACNDGKKFINGQRSKSIVCNEVGQWNDTDVSCKSERCDSVVILANSLPDKLNTDWYVVVKYECKRGHYRPDGLPFFAIKCLVGGIWNDTYDATKDCKIKSCPPIEASNNSTANNTQDSVYGTVLAYTCNPGFKYPDGESVKQRTCNEDAQWSPSDFPSCQIVYCDALPEVKNTTRDSNDTHFSSRVTFQCFPGFQFPDRSKRKVVTCTENATWTELPEPCEVVFCPPVPYWAPNVFNATDNNFLSTIEYHCKGDYAFKLSHDKPGNLTTLISTCQPSKQWQPPIEICYALSAINADIAGKAWESPQAYSLGTIACVVVGIVFAIIFFIDLRKIITDLQLMKKNINGVLKSRKKNRVRPTK